MQLQPNVFKHLLADSSEGWINMVQVGMKWECDRLERKKGLRCCSSMWSKVQGEEKCLQQPRAPESGVCVWFRGLFKAQYIPSPLSLSLFLSLCLSLSPCVFLHLSSRSASFQVRAAAVHSVLHPGSDDDCSLRSDFQRALPRHSVWAGPEHREHRWDPAKAQTKQTKKAVSLHWFNSDRSSKLL